MNHTQVTTIVTSTQMDLVRGGWLHAKSQKSGSAKTVTAYSNTLDQFRAALQYKGLELDMLSDKPQEHLRGMSERQVVTLTAQEFASWSAQGKTVKPATLNQRLAILSSFYEYAILNDFLTYNPIKKVKRSTVQRYKGARPIPHEQTEEAFERIDRDSLRGKRDYAILAVLLATGRRVSEVASLRWSNLEIGRGEIVTIIFDDLKGDKGISDRLDQATSDVLLSWLRNYYGSLESLQPDTALWVSLAVGGHNGRSYGQPLSIWSFKDICKRHLDTTKVHRTRHTWTKNMLEEGAPLPLIQKKLGHSSLATTGIYASSLESEDNPYVERIARRAGIK